MSQKTKSIVGQKNSIQSESEIRFYRSNEKPYGAFSNLFRATVEYDGIVYPTSEHAYQAGKAAKPAVRDWILSAPSPSLAAMAAHGLYSWDIVPKWAEIKFDRMRGVLMAKFTQHSDLADLLISTGHARIVESATTNNAVNRLWGEVNGKGENMLGIMLMEVRDALSATSTSEAMSSQADPTKSRTIPPASTEMSAVAK